MLTRIVQPAPALETYLASLHLNLSQPQAEHLLNLVDGLLVCDEPKTLAALQRQFLDTTDPSNWADFLRISPWSAAEARDALRRHQVTWLLELAQARGLPKVLYVNLDDSLGKKDKHTAHIEPVDWFHDHNESTPRQPRYHKAFCYLECTLRVGDLTATADLRLYLRDKTVRRLNRHRPPEHRVHFRSKFHLAREILEALKPFLPADWTTYVQFDSWYASEKLLRYVHRRGWHAVCALKSNRTLRGQRLSQFAATLRHKRYTHVRVTAADGNTTTYHVRDAVGRLSKVPFDVRVMFSKRHPRARSWAYFASTDLARSVVETLRGYGGRWTCEVVNFYAKARLGLADFRVRSLEAVERYVVAVHLAWAYVEVRLARERSAQVRCYGDVLRRHRDDHAAAWLRAAVEQGIRTGDIEAVLKRFLRQTG
jgi:DDE superfamily endonuclease